MKLFLSLCKKRLSAFVPVCWLSSDKVIECDAFRLFLLFNTFHLCKQGDVGVNLHIEGGDSITGALADRVVYPPLPLCGTPGCEPVTARQDGRSAHCEQDAHFSFLWY